MKRLKGVEGITAQLCVMAAHLTAAFGFGFTNGFAAYTSKPGPAYFLDSKQMLPLPKFTTCFLTC